ncbi:MAG: hypothetical protein ACRERU_08980, partial [Methylococcales bacterium]
SGGIPPLKPFIERVAATCLGQPAILILDSPEQRGSRQKPATVTVLNYDDRVAEQETLRFHCAEALRNQDYAVAYGLASRFPDLAWANPVRNRVGPLLELPGGPLQINGRSIESFALNACQVEIRLCMGDVAGALIRLARFIESSTWALVAAYLQEQKLSLTVSRDHECLRGDLAPDHPLITDNLVKENGRESYHYDVVGLMWNWPEWLKRNATDQSKREPALAELQKAYNKPRNSALPAREYRNRIVHGSDTPVSLMDIETCLRGNCLIADTKKSFGQNFLAVTAVNDLLSGLGVSNLASAIGGQLNDLVSTVVKA